MAPSATTKTIAQPRAQDPETERTSKSRQRTAKCRNNKGLPGLQTASTAAKGNAQRDTLNLITRSEPDFNAIYLPTARVPTSDCNDGVMDEQERGQTETESPQKTEA